MKIKFSISIFLLILLIFGVIGVINLFRNAIYFDGTAYDLYYEFYEDESTSNEYYGGRVVIISGDVNQTIVNNSEVTISISDVALCTVDYEHFMGYDTGYDITVKGRFDRFDHNGIVGNKFIFLKDCQIIDE
jgi:hypothetical protein